MATNRVHGRVTSFDGVPQVGLTVHVYERRVPSTDSSLGFALTGPDGRYDIAYDIAQAWGGQRARPSLVVRVQSNVNVENGEGELLYTSKVYYQSRVEECIDIRLGSGVTERAESHRSQSRRLQAFLAPGVELGGLSAGEVTQLSAAAGVPGDAAALTSKLHAIFPDGYASALPSFAALQNRYTDPTELVADLREALYGLAEGGYAFEPLTFASASETKLVSKVQARAGAGQVSDALDRQSVLVTVGGFADPFGVSIDQVAYALSPRGGETAAGMASRLADVVAVARPDCMVNRTNAQLRIYGPVLGQITVTAIGAAVVVTDVATPRGVELARHLRDVALTETIARQEPWVQVIRDHGNLTDAQLFDVLLAYGNAASPEAFWQLNPPPAGLTVAAFDRLRLVVQLSGITLASTTMVGQLLNWVPPGGGAVMQLLDVVPISQAEIAARVDVIAAQGLPAGIPGGTDVSRRAAYVQAILRSIEDAFPSASLRRRILDSADAAWNVVRPHLVANAAFDFDTLEPASGDANVQTKLAAIQRLFKVSHRWASVSTLYSLGITSARDIARVPAWTFIQGHAAAMGWQLARTVHTRATQIAGTAAATLGEFGGSTYTLLPQTIAGRGAMPTAEMDDLFGATDFCSCDHDDSVFSASAYFVDLLDFCQGAPLEGPLFERRSDLWTLLLTRRNTYDRVPQIDLAIELMEWKVALAVLPPAFPPPVEPERETNERLEVLQAMPQRTYWEAYEGAGLGSPNHTFPFGLPFDLAAHEARRYLPFLDVTVLEVLQTFHRSGIVDGPRSAPAFATEAYVAERLGIDRRVQAVLLADNIGPQYWGLVGDVAAYFNLLAPVPGRLRDILGRSELGDDVPAFVECLRSRFVAGGGVAPALNNIGVACNLDEVTSSNFTAQNLGRLSQFLRLRMFLERLHARKDRPRSELHWELDRALVGLLAGPVALSTVTLKQLAPAQAGAERLDIRLEEASSLWWRSVGGAWVSDTYVYATSQGTPVPSLYARVFLARPAGQTLDSVLALDAFGALANPTTAGAAAAEIAGALRISISDVELLVKRLAAPVGAWDAQVVSLPLLAEMHGHALAARFIGASISDLHTMIDLSGVDPFVPGQSENLLALAEIVQDVAKTGLTVAALDAVLRRQESPRRPVLRASGELEQLLAALNGIMAMAEASFVEDVDEDRGGGAVRRKLAVWGVNDTDVEALLAWVFDPSANPVPPLPVAGGVLSFLTAAEYDELGLLGPDPISRLRYLDSKVVAQLRLRQERQGFGATLAANFGVEEATMLRMLDPYVRGASADGVAALVDLRRVRDDLGNDLTPTRLATLRRLEQVAYLVRAAGLRTAEVDWFFRVHGADNSPIRVLPVTPDAAVPAAAFDAWRGLAAMVRSRALLEERLTGLLTFAPVEMVAGLAELESLTAWPAQEVEALVTRFNGGVAPAADALADVRVWLRLAEAFYLAERSGVPVGTWVAPAGGARTPWVDIWEAGVAVSRQVPGNEIRRAARLRLGEEEWLARAPAVRNELRRLQRDALAGYLMQHPSALSPNPIEARLHDFDAVSDKILIDIQVEPKVTISRLLQATSSVQTYVQRWILGLEGQQALDADQRAQWDWLRRYRVWEANRKIFLYPENWLEPELRDDKTPLFKVFESALRQNDGSQEAIEQAFGQYLLGLEEVANLQVAATFHELEYAPEDPEGRHGPVTDNLHVLAKTRGSPERWFYRVWRDQQLWTGWERVDIDVAGNLVALLVHRKVVYIFWAELKPAAPRVNTETLPKPINAAGELQDLGAPTNPEGGTKGTFAWIRRVNGTWSSRRSAKAGFVLDHPTDHPAFNSIYLDAEVDAANGIIIRVMEYPEVVAEIAFQPGIERASIVNFSPAERTARWSPWSPEHLTYRQYLRALVIERRLPTPPSVPPLVLPVAPASAEADDESPHHGASLLTSPPEQYYLLLSTQEQGYLPWHPVFYFDSERSFLITRFDAVARSQRGATSERAVQPAFEARSAIAATNLCAADIIPVSSHAEVSRFRLGRPTTQLAPGTARVLTLALSAPPDTVGEDVRCEPAVSPGVPIGQAQFATAIQVGQQRFRFHAFDHSFADLLMSEFARGGVTRLFRREVQAHPEVLTAEPVRPFNDYGPNLEWVAEPHPKEDFDWACESPFGTYNWELFFHAPFLVACRLIDDGRYEEAQRWLHHIFDPTAGLHLEGVSSTADFWGFEPFNRRQTTGMQTNLSELGLLLSNPADEAERAGQLAVEDRVRRQVLAWMENPFRPHAVARTRTIAYEKAVVMKYLDMLIAWGDSLFRQDTLETVNEAALLYMFAARILGPRPIEFPAIDGGLPRNYISLADPTNRAVQLENWLPRGATFMVRRGATAEIPATAQAIPVPRGFFCVPPNDRLLGYWDTVGDRLFKIRNSLNIDGLERTLALFAPPIDPGLLARAVASGVSLDEALLGLSASTLPKYRFRVLVQKALEVASEARQLGGALLSAIEKRDAEALAVLRSSHELDLLRLVRTTRQEAVRESNANLEALRASRRLAEERQRYYASRPALIPEEKETLDRQGEAAQLQAETVSLHGGLGQLSLFPLFDWGASGFGGTPRAVVNMTQAMLTGIIQAQISSKGALAGMKGQQASIAGTRASYRRRADDWKHQEELAKLEMKQADRQILAAEVRLAMTEYELRAHDLRIEQQQQADARLRTKFSNAELYDWMRAELQAVYRDVFDLAVDVARQAERAFAYELGEDLGSGAFVRLGHWENARSGLMAAERLIQDLRRMDVAFHERNRREYEITKHISLARLDPEALVRLRATGQADFTLTEALFDRDYPGHYLRRIQSVAVTIPAVTGPYEGVHCRLRLTENRIRALPTLQEVGQEVVYLEQAPDDPRFRHQWGLLQAIVTSSGQNDAMVQGGGDDGRYQPFEGCGAISQWRIDLPQVDNGFDVSGISDVVLHVRYTAREGGEALAASARQAAWVVAEADPFFGGHALVSLRTDFPDVWAALTDATVQGNRAGTIGLRQEHFPYAPHLTGARIQELAVVVRRAPNASVWVQDRLELALNPGGTFVPNPMAQGGFGSFPVSVKPGIWQVPQDFDVSVDGAAFDSSEVEDVFLLVRFDTGVDGSILIGSIPWGHGWDFSAAALVPIGDVPSVVGGPALVLTSGTYQGNVATGPLTFEDVSDRVDQAIESPVGQNARFDVTDPSLVMGAAGLHVRVIVKNTLGAGNGQILRLGAGAPNYIQLFNNPPGGSIFARVYVNGSLMQANVVAVPGDWVLVDVTVRRDPASNGGNSTAVELMVNGQSMRLSSAAHPFNGVDAGELDVLHAGGTGYSPTPILFVGLRASETFSLAEHQAHYAASSLSGI